MIISPNTLRLQIVSKLKTMLQKAGSAPTELDVPFDLTSWNAMNHISKTANSSKILHFKVVSAKWDDTQTALINVKSQNNSMEFELDMGLLNLEDSYALYGALSNKLTTVAPSYIEISDEV